MNRTGRSQLALGVILLLLGGWFLLNQVNPAFRNFFEPYTEWPVNLLLIGAGILVIGLATGSPGLAVPAAIVAGIGGIFYYQEKFSDSSSWSYMWTLIPGFVGVGTILAGLLGENTSRNISSGLKTIVFSAVLFLVFGTFFGDLKFLGEYGVAILLILFGVFILARGLWRGGGRNETG